MERRATEPDRRKSSMSGDIDLLHPLPAGRGVNVLAYTPLDPQRGSLFGFCDLHIPGYRLRLFGCTAHVQGDRRWVGLPAWLGMTPTSTTARSAATCRR